MAVIQNMIFRAAILRSLSRLCRGHGLGFILITSLAGRKNFVSKHLAIQTENSVGSQKPSTTIELALSANSLQILEMNDIVDVLMAWESAKPLT